MNMNKSKCQIENHQGRNIVSICFSTQCQGKRQCCQICQNQLHKDHTDQLVDLDYLLSFIKAESQKPSILQPRINQRLETLQKLLINLEELTILIRKEMDQLSAINVQQICKDLGNKYNILKEDAQVLSNQDWNKLAQDMLSNLSIKDCEIISKDATDLLTKSMTNIRDKFKQIQEQLAYIEQKEYFQNFKGPQLMKGHQDTVFGIDICKHRNLLASGSDDKTVKLWNLVDNTLIKSYDYSGEVYDVVFSNQGNLLAFGGGGGGDYSIKLIDISDLQKNEVTTQLCGHTSHIYRLKFSNDSKYLVSGSNDETVRIWSLNTKKEAFQFNSESSVNGVAISADDSIIASNSDDGQIRIWGFQERKLLCSQPAHNSSGYGIEFSNDQKMLVSCGEDGLIKLWSLQELKNQSKLSLISTYKAANNPIWTVQFSACSKFIISISNEDREIKVLDTQTGEVVQLFQSQSTNGKTVVDVAISKDMEIIAFGEDNNIAVWRNKQ